MKKLIVHATILTVVVLPIALLVMAGGSCGCNSQSPVFTPAKDDPRWHCRDLEGNVLVDSTWCYPTTGTHDCCDIGGTCLRNDPKSCEYPAVVAPNGDLFSAKRRIGPRRPENPGAAP